MTYGTAMNKAKEAKTHADAAASSAKDDHQRQLARAVSLLSEAVAEMARQARMND